MSIKFAITYEKGGCGKTTTAVNLSAILAERGYKVLLVDLDCQAYSTSYYDMYDANRADVFDVMTGNAEAKECIAETKFKNLFLLPASYHLKNIETFLMMKTRSQEYTLKKALADVDDSFDIIIMDCPPSGERIKENALAFADFVILPTIPDDYAIHGLECIANEILEIRQDVNPRLRVLGLLLTLCENTVNKNAYKKALQEQDIFPCFRNVIRKNTTLSEAINHHKPINVYNRKCNGFEDYNNLTDEILLAIGYGGEKK